MIGTVLGPLRVRSTLPGAEQLRWVQIRCGGQIIEAADLVGAAPGDRVLVCRGDAAARMVPESPADAAVTAILETEEKEVDRSEQKRL